MIGLWQLNCNTKTVELLTLNLQVLINASLLKILKDLTTFHYTICSNNLIKLGDHTFKNICYCKVLHFSSKKVFVHERFSNAFN